MSYGVWRKVHRSASYLVALIAIVHMGMTFVIYDEWSPDAVWFGGTGVGLLWMAVVNTAHVGLEPCRQPTAPIVRRLNWVLVALGLAAIAAVPEPQAYAIMTLITDQRTAQTTRAPNAATT